MPGGARPRIVKERLASRYRGKSRKNLVEDALHKIETMTWPKARDELLPYLDPSDASRIDEATEASFSILDAMAMWELYTLRRPQPIGRLLRWANNVGIAAIDIP